MPALDAFGPQVVSGEPPISRAEAVRRVLLDNFLRRQIDAGAVSADRVSLIKIQSEDAAGAAVPFALLPLDATLAERIDAALDDPRSHGPYLPALSKLVEFVTLDAEE